MGRPFLTIRSSTILCLIWQTIVAEFEVDPAWEDIFKARSDDDWRSVWHTERHPRCYKYLEAHMEWVCNKDIYAVQRKKRSTNPELFMDNQNADRLLGRHQKRHEAVQQFVGEGGITEECCNDAGCSWEEYAEYCPANSRLRS